MRSTAPTRLLALLLLTALVGCQDCSRSAPDDPAFATPKDLPGLCNFAQVSPALYRGAQPTREGFIELRRMGVRSIIDLRADHSDAEAIEGLGFRYIQAGCEACDVGDRQVLAVLQAAADPAAGPVFVHCQQGADRTGCAIAAWRIVEQGWSADRAIAEMRRFGFHPFFAGIPRYLRNLDPAAFTSRTAIPSPLPPPGTRQ